VGKPDLHYHIIITIRSLWISFWLIGRGRLTHKGKSQLCDEKEIYLVPRCLEVLERYWRIF
jgi:hypothetical protein